MACNTEGCPGSLFPSGFLIFIIIFSKCRFSVDCEVDEWKPWGDCSATCDGGTKTRAREVVEEPMNGGAACPDLEETETCNTDQCEGTLVSYYVLR